MIARIWRSWNRKARRAAAPRPRRLGLETLEAKTLLATLPTGFVETRVASALASPTALEIAPDGRVFVAQQNGTIRIVKNDALLPTPFATLPVDASYERGLLGITLDPHFDHNGYVYVYYTAAGTGGAESHNRVSRLTAAGDQSAGSEQVLLDLGPVGDAHWHMGGAIHFGPDGMLYVATGDQQTPASSQSLDNPFGKILRIHPDGTIPTDNPFYGAATGVNRAIWALGLRNPFTFSFQSGSGRMFINDVGETNWEEINDG
ncbi:MAG: PQQ-dependent sugar dehydrogenase, partial [Pirellulaceae bacterium]|nr:PQQ-dependent sugar dehydrogenase [Pirellulaceae bacterium]